MGCGLSFLGSCWTYAYFQPSYVEHDLNWIRVGGPSCRGATLFLEDPKIKDKWPARLHPSLEDLSLIAIPRV